jgi:hypothetical protein
MSEQSTTWRSRPTAPTQLFWPWFGAIVSALGLAYYSFPLEPLRTPRAAHDDRRGPR